MKSEKTYRHVSKKGQSGNPKGRPKGRKNNAGLLSDAFFKTVRIKDAEGFRNVPKIVAATEVCLNNALKGDLRSFVKLERDEFKLRRILRFRNSWRILLG
jgi:hypothetical protein